MKINNIDISNYSAELINRQALHSYKLTFIHPVTKKVVSLEAPLPNDIKNIINN